MSQKDKIIKSICNVLYLANKDVLERKENFLNVCTNNKKAWYDPKTGEKAPAKFNLPRLFNPKKHLEKRVRETWEKIPKTERSNDMNKMLNKVMSILQQEGI